jgi:hypothetical protein
MHHLRIAAQLLVDVQVWINDELAYRKDGRLRTERLPLSSHITHLVLTFVVIEPVTEQISKGTLFVLSANNLYF